MNKNMGRNCYRKPTNKCRRKEGIRKAPLIITLTTWGRKKHQWRLKLVDETGSQKRCLPYLRISTHKLSIMYKGEK